MALRSDFVCGGEAMLNGHLERREVILRLLAPVHIGSGERLNKKEYIFDGRSGSIYFPDFARLFTFLKERSLISKYEEFLLKPRDNDFRVFLGSHNITEADYPVFVRYQIAAGEAARSANFREVLTFIKDSAGRPYIPGSSLKGAIRTAIAAYLTQQGDWERSRQAIETADASAPPRRYLASETRSLESRVFYRLGIQDRNGRIINDPVNDFMQGIRISDSAPMSFANLTLAGKYDRRTDGTVNSLPIFRECLIPGTEAHFMLTLDLPILAKVGLNLKIIEKALHIFADDHYANFEHAFPELPDDAPAAATQGVDLILGGGAGYVSKTITYNLFSPRNRAGAQTPEQEQDNNRARDQKLQPGREQVTERSRALPLVSRILAKQFARHGHANDAQRHKVSPRMLKTTMYAGTYYQMGRCELIIK